jgi:hypothetical protein
MRSLIVLLVSSLGCAGLPGMPGYAGDPEREAVVCTAENESAGMQILVWSQSTPTRAVVRGELWNAMPNKNVFAEWVALCILRSPYAQIVSEKGEPLGTVEPLTRYVYLPVPTPAPAPELPTPVPAE